MRPVWDAETARVALISKQLWSNFFLKKDANDPKSKDSNSQIDTINLFYLDPGTHTNANVMDHTNEFAAKLSLLNVLGRTRSVLSSTPAHKLCSSSRLRTNYDPLVGRAQIHPLVGYAQTLILLSAAHKHRSSCRLRRFQINGAQLSPRPWRPRSRVDATALSGSAGPVRRQVHVCEGVRDGRKEEAASHGTVRRTAAHEAELKDVPVLDILRVCRSLLASDHGLHAPVDTRHFAYLVQGRAPVNTAFSEVHVGGAASPVHEETGWRHLVRG